MTRNFITYASFILFIVLSGCQIDPRSFDFKRSDIIGEFIANHSGNETLLIRDDGLWIRNYNLSNDTLYVDTGKWWIDSIYSNDPRLVLENFFLRHDPWIRLWHGSNDDVNYEPPIDSTEIRFLESIEAADASKGYLRVYFVPVHIDKGVVKILFNLDDDKYHYWKKVDVP